MAKIYAFQPYRYTSRAGDLDNLATQPYDKISPEMRARYLSLSPYNFVRVILGERFESDSEANNVYTRAAAHLETWIRDGILAQDREPSLFAYSQEFEVPGSIERLVRNGFIATGAVEDYSAGVVHRHEQTLSGPKKDRLELLRHTHSHFGQIFMLYPDPERVVDALIEQAEQAAPTAVVTDEYGTIHRVWKISDPAVIAEIQRQMADKKLLIADGHHRYETALAFRNENPQLEDAGRVMMTFVNMYSPGLKILATHRVIRNLESFDAEAFLRAAAASFRVTPLDSPGALQTAWAQPHTDVARIGVAIPGAVYLLERARGGKLDVSTLHEDLLAGMLGIGEAAVRDEKYLKYMRGVDAAVEELGRSGAQAAFLLEPVAVDEVARISFSGGVMPQKSTDFYPKLLSGLTIYRLEK